MTKHSIINLTSLLIVISVIASWYVSYAIISPFLHYQLQQTAFISGIDFLHEFTDYPGGVADYCAVFISQFFSFKLGGSVILVLFASFAGLIVLNIIHLISGKTRFDFSVFSLTLFFGILVFTSYYFPYYISIRLLFALLFTWCFCWLHLRIPNWSIGIWIFLIVLLFYLASGPAIFVFAFSTAFIYLITQSERSKYLIAFSGLLIAAALPYLGFKFIFSMNVENLYRISIMKPPAMLAYTPGMPVFVYYSLLPLFLLLSFLLKTADSKGSSQFSFLKRGIFVVSLQLLAFIALSVILFKRDFDPHKKNLLTIEYLAENEKWNELLEATSKIKEYDFKVNFHGARALSHLGLLADQLFDYPQLTGSSGLFIDAGMARNESIIMSDLYFELGLMSESQHWAFESQTLLPHSPRILKRLIIINLVNGNYMLAEKFLNLLDRNMLYRNWAGVYKAYVSDTSLAGKDKLIAEKRRFSPLKSTVNLSNESNLRLLVDTNPNNRMAYDYLMSLYLLDLNFLYFGDYLKFYKNFYSKKLPRPWEEALFIYTSIHNVLPPEVPSGLLTESGRKRFTDFSRTIQQHNGDITAARNSLYSKYGNSYWFYNVYLNPVVTKTNANKPTIK